MEKRNQNSGSLNVSENVIASVANLAASETHGVFEMSQAPVDIKSVLNHKDMPKSVRINVVNEAAYIDLYVKLEYDAKIPEVCSEIQRRVKESVQSMTGMIVARVNVHVTDVEVPEKE